MTDRERSTGPAPAAAGADGRATPSDAFTEAPVLVAQHVAASPEKVFDFLVEPDRVLRWLGTAVDIDPQPGGRFWMEANGTDAASGTYREVVRPERVVFSFGWEGSADVPPGSTTVTITLEALADGTTSVRLRHDGLPGGPADDHGKGWTHLLGRLAAVATDVDPGPLDH